MNSVKITSIIIALLVSVTYSLSDYEKWQRQQNRALEQFRNNRNSKLNKWQEDRNQKLNLFISKMNRKWGSYSKPINSNWVEYRDGGNSKSVVDFKRGIVTVQVIVENGENGKEKLEKAVEETLKSRGSSDIIPIESIDKSTIIAEKPLLENIVASDNGSVVKDSKVFAHKISMNNSKETVNDNVKIIAVSFSLIPDFLKKKMAPYMNLIDKYSKIYGIEKAHVLATIHTESYFNPAACSNVGAIGLMQLMPESGGRDAYQYVTGINAIPTLKYLYNPENNIKLGCAYIKILQDKYFREIGSNNSKRYCVISAYNTGAGNVARAFNGEIGKSSGMYSVSKAVVKINKLNSNGVYSKLMKSLPYDETKEYLNNVNNRINKYGGDN